MKNKKGISLIVLIVTIIVIIILAAAVILTLNQNNPIDSSRVAQLADNRANINSAISLYYGKQTAVTKGVYDANQIFTLVDVSDDDKKLITGAKEADKATALVSTQLATSDYYKLADGDNAVLGILIPDITDATWYLDVNTGIVYLTYADKASMPAWMFTDGNARTQMDSTLSEFVKLSSINSTTGKLNDVISSSSET